MSLGAKLGILAAVLVAVSCIVWVIFTVSDSSPSESGTGNVRTRNGEAQFGKPTDLKSLSDFYETRVTSVEGILKRQGQVQDQQTKLLGEISRRMGIMEIGLKGVAQLRPEEAARQEALAALSDDVRGLVPEGTIYLANQARERGTFDPRDSKPLLNAWLSAKLGGRPLGDQSEPFFTACAIQREPLADGHVRATTQLSTRRLEKGIKPDELYTIARMVWEARGNYPSATPGQMLAMAHQISQMAGGPGETAQIANAGTSAVTVGNMAPPQPLLVAGYSVPRADLGNLLAASAPFMPETTGVENMARGATLPLANGLGDGLSGVLTESAFRDTVVEGVRPLAGFELADLPIKGVPEQHFVVVAATVRGLVLGDLIAAARLRGEAVSLDAATVIARLKVAAGKLDEPFFKGLTDGGYQPLRWTISIADRLGVKRPDFSRVNVAALDSELRVAMDDVIAKKAIPDDLTPAFRVHSPIVAVAAQIGEGGSDRDPKVATRQAVYRSAAYLLGARICAQQIRGRVLDQYATLFANSSRNWSDTAVEAERKAHAALVDGLAATSMNLEVSGIAGLASQVSKHALISAETFLASVAVRDYVGKSIDSGAVGAAAGLTRRVRAWADEQINAQVVPPFTVERLSAIAQNIRQDVEAMLAGRKRVPAADGVRVGASGVSGAPIAFTPTRPVQVIDLVPTSQQKSTKVLTIPAGSFGQAKILMALDAELGGVEKEILLNLDYMWNGPSGTKLRMRDLRIIAMARAQNGPARVDITLSKISYVFPSGQVWQADVKGFVGDASGRRGAGGYWDLHMTEIAPLAGTAGALQGVANAFAPDQTLVVSDTGSSISTPSPSTAAEKGLSSGLNAAVLPYTKLANRVVDQWNPSVPIDNGRAVTCVISDKVEIPIPITDYDQVVEVLASQPRQTGFAHAR